MVVPPDSVPGEHSGKRCADAIVAAGLHCRSTVLWHTEPVGARGGLPPHAQAGQGLPGCVPSHVSTSRNLYDPATHRTAPMCVQCTQCLGAMKTQQLKSECKVLMHALLGPSGSFNVVACPGCRDLFYWDHVHPLDGTGHKGLTDLLVAHIQSTARSLAERPLDVEDETEAQVRVCAYWVMCQGAAQGMRGAPA